MLPRAKGAMLLMVRILSFAITLSLVSSFARADSNEQFVLTISNSILWKDQFSYDDAIYLPDGNAVVIRGWLWDCKTEKLIRRLNEFRPGQEHCALSPCGKTLALIDQGWRGPKNLTHGYGITLVEVETGKQIHTFDIPDASLPGGKVFFRDDGTAVYALSSDKVFVLSVTDKKLVATFSYSGWRHSGVSPDGRILAEARPYYPPSDTKKDAFRFCFQMCLSTLDAQRTTHELLPIEEGNVERVAFTSDGQYVCATLNESNQPMSSILWKVKTRERIETEKTHEGVPYHVFSGRIFKERYVIMVDNKTERNAVLDLSSGKIVPIQVNQSGKSLIIGIAPNGENCVVSRYVATEKPQHWLALGRLGRRNTQQGAPAETVR